MYRSLKNQKSYDEYAKTQTAECALCETVEKVDETENFFIVVNTFGYDIWDRREVEEHLMVIPKKHYGEVDEFGEEMEKEYMQILKKYFKNNYDIFTRSTNSIRKTQTHFHTHLIKLKGDVIQDLHFTAKPYTLDYK